MLGCKEISACRTVSTGESRFNSRYRIGKGICRLGQIIAVRVGIVGRRVGDAFWAGVRCSQAEDGRSGLTSLGSAGVSVVLVDTVRVSVDDPNIVHVGEVNRNPAGIGAGTVNGPTAEERLRNGVLEDLVRIPCGFDNPQVSAVGGDATGTAIATC